MAKKATKTKTTKAKKKLSPQERGHRGGMATSLSHGKEFYQAIGRKGGMKVRDERGAEFFAEISLKGWRDKPKRVLVARPQKERDIDRKLSRRWW